MISTDQKENEVSAYSSDEKNSKNSINQPETDKNEEILQKASAGAFFNYDFKLMLDKKLNKLKFPFSDKSFKENLINALGKKKYIDSVIDNPNQNDFNNNSEENNNFDLYQYNMLKNYIKTKVNY